MTGAAFSAQDHVHMAHALRLAELGLCTTQPNPRVGCVIVLGDEVVAEGWHQRAGEAHAETIALAVAGARARAATAYVTLEPCGLHGRTPPCADALIAAGISRIVIASEDSFQCEGRALERLRAAGIEVQSGLLREAARELNCGFFSRIERGLPWLRIKLAMSLDGRTALANGDSKWITGAPARADVQRWRARSSAILTGSGSVRADDPQLTVRDQKNLSAAIASKNRRRQEDHHNQAASGVSPLRVVLDRFLRTSRGAHILDGSAPTLVLHAPSVQANDDCFMHVELYPLDCHATGFDLSAVMRLLAMRGMNEVQVETGATLCGALFGGGLVDELLLYIAPVLLGDRAQPLFVLPSLSQMTERWKLHVLDQRQIGDDIRLRLRPAAP